ncbi:hypothetical protein [Microvirga sp. BSC39]|uniref:hypothetical protein n=1 Tax=Microvirga sp. BSC39 TaxID=1549810 RepID=UPI0004E90875|nr:hypothetical protein [Microvirga sp. BSC39]KFG68715.1 hypothetical protein JH26_14705 [Microvirga sp. BSC39]
MTMIYQVVCDEAGVVRTAVTSNELQEGATEVDREIYADVASRVGRVRLVNGMPIDYEPPPPAPGPIHVYKAPMFRKMTDAEYEAYLQIRAGFPPRLQAIFDAAEYLSSDDEFWPALVAAAEQAYGAERASEILAPSA